MYVISIFPFITNISPRHAVEAQLSGVAKGGGRGGLGDFRAWLH